MNNEQSSQVQDKAKHFEGERRAHQHKKYEFEHNVEHGFPAEQRDKEIKRHAKRLERTLQIDSETAVRIARKQHGMSSIRTTDSSLNRLLVIKDSPIERAAHGTPWQKHGIRPAPEETKRRAIDTAKEYSNKQREDRKAISRRRRRAAKQPNKMNVIPKDEEKDENSDEQEFATKPEMQIFTLVNDDSDDELGDEDAHALQYIRKKRRERNLVHQAYESSKVHKEEALRILNAPEKQATTSIFDWSFD